MTKQAPRNQTVSDGRDAADDRVGSAVESADTNAVREERANGNNVPKPKADPTRGSEAERSSVPISTPSTRDLATAWLGAGN